MLLPLPVIFLLVLNSSLYYKGIEVYKLYFPNTLVNFLPVGFHSQETLSRDCKVRERKGLFCFLVLVIPPTAATDNCRLHHHLWWLQNSRTNEDLQQTCRACTLGSSRHLIFDNILFSFLLIQQSTFILTHKHTHTHTALPGIQPGAQRASRNDPPRNQRVALVHITVSGCQSGFSACVHWRELLK